MPVVFIVIIVAALIGIGGYFFRPTDTTPTPNIEISGNTERPENTSNTGTTDTEATNVSAYTNGTYTATGNYTAPNSTSHDVTVELTVANDVVTNATVTYSGDGDRESAGYQGRFTNAFQAQVVGKKISDIALARVGGASLTTGAFNKALNDIKTEAQSS